MSTFTEGEDYYYDEKGFFVFTEKHHRLRGYCCGFGCRECPFGFAAVPEPRRSLLLLEREEKPGENHPPDDMG